MLLIQNPISAYRSLPIMNRIRGETKRITRIPAELRRCAAGRMPHFLDVLLQALGMGLLASGKIKEDPFALRFGKSPCIGREKLRYFAI
jgi:hypothetical protein